MAKEPAIAKLFAVIGGKKYELVPSGTCKGCAFEKKCYRAMRSLTCPVFNDYTLASDIDVIYKEVKDGNDIPGRSGNGLRRGG